MRDTDNVPFLFVVLRLRIPTPLHSRSGISSILAISGKVCRPTDISGIKENVV